MVASWQAPLSCIVATPTSGYALKESVSSGQAIAAGPKMVMSLAISGGDIGATIAGAPVLVTCEPPQGARCPAVGGGGGTGRAIAVPLYFLPPGA